MVVPEGGDDDDNIYEAYPENDINTPLPPDEIYDDAAGMKINRFLIPETIHIS